MGGSGISRRRLLTGAVLGAGLAAPVLLCGRARAEGYRNAPSGPTVTFGLAVPLSGPDAAEGEDARRGFALAVRHINGEGDGGMLGSFAPRSLRGKGVLGRKVVMVAGDTEAASDPARAAARRMIEAERAIMIAGGAAPGVATALQGLCQQSGVLFMAGFADDGTLTGRDCRANGFRHFFTTAMAGAALAAALADRRGGGRMVGHLTAGTGWARGQEAAVRHATEARGWQTVARASAAPGAGDFAPLLAPLAEAQADVLVLNLAGADLVAALTATLRLGLRERVVNGRDLVLVVPRLSDAAAAAAGEAARGVLGAANWHWSLQDEGSKAFVKAFGTEYGVPPGQAAQTCYAQAILYADACERAGDFRPSAVGAALEDFAFDGLGNGPTLYRGADHQCFKDVPVVRGKEQPTSRFDLIDVVTAVPRAAVEYPPDRDGCRLGPFNDGS